MNFSEAQFYENYLNLTSDFYPLKHVYFKTCLPTGQDGFQNRNKVYYICVKDHQQAFIIVKCQMKLT